MGITTSQQLQNYYDIFRDTEVIYTKDVLRTLAVDPRQIYVKCNGAQWPCIINSTSFINARIIVGTKGGAFAAMAKKDPPPVSLRFFFAQINDQPISFFVTGRVTEVSQYMNSTELAIITITFSQRPPDDLIERVGSMLEANSNAIRRKEERIIITDDTKRRLFISKDETIIFIQNVPRRCILRDISFSGAKVILLGIEKFINQKQIILRIHFEEPDEIITLEGHVVKTSPVEERPEIIYACLQFDEAKVPTSYKIRINTYLTTVRKNILSAVSQEQEDAQKNTEKKHLEPQKTAAAKAAEDSGTPESENGSSQDNPIAAETLEPPAEETSEAQPSNAAAEEKPAEAAAGTPNA
ncbi:MAG: PilZ domain-containing protein [Treponema sp.]|nr:PilZ domain-containing protein [Candidatus Treponema merdequi]